MTTNAQAEVIGPGMTPAQLLRVWAGKLVEMADALDAGKLKDCCGAGEIALYDDGQYRIDIEMHLIPPDMPTKDERLKQFVLALMPAEGGKQ
jgi:hypothetical protein